MTTAVQCMEAGDYVVIQRQTFMKLHKLKSTGIVSLGKDQIELVNAIGKPYFSTFRMVTGTKNKRIFSLETSEYINSIQNLNIDKSGVDNRNIIDDGKSQTLTTDEINKLRDDALSSSDIVGKLISNSKTFSDKTEYSQAKYLKKKEKKYLEYIQIRKPSLRLIAEIYYRQDPGKVLGIRIDDLSQILTYSNVQDNSKVLLYDSGSCGLLSASIIDRIGQNTLGTLVHMHPGNVCQKEAFLALQLPAEQSERCINVCLYSVLRCFYQEQNQILVETNDEKQDNEEMEKQHTADDAETIEHSNKRKRSNQEDSKPAKRACWQIENEKACKILINKVDSLIIVAKEHPSSIVKELLIFLNDGKPFVIFSLLRESLENLYIELKNRADIISLRLFNTMMRNYQVLPNRTHPDVTMTTGGYILTGFKINCTITE